MRHNFLHLSLIFFSLSIVGFAQEEGATTGAKSSEKSPVGAENAETYQQIVNALHTGDVTKFLEFTEGTKNPTFMSFRADLLHNRGEQRFFTGDIVGSLVDFDEVIKLDPKRDPYHWQRGISLYYADRFQEGKEQFERHQTVNSQDVENAVWHFLCSVRAPGGTLDQARQKLIPIAGDTRVPMKEIHALFAGTDSEDAVLAAAAKVGNPEKSAEAKNAFLYAHLYLGIYHEAIGNAEKMKEHIAKSVGVFAMDHYMGKVAQVHAKLRKLQ